MASPATTFIYALKDPRDGKIRYVGKSNRPSIRLRRHCQGREGKHRKNWINQLKRLALKPKLEILDEIPSKDWEFWEKEYIKLFRAVGFSLTNTSDGGVGSANTVPWNKGLKLSPEYRKKLSVAHMGQPAWNKGMRLSPEHRQRLGQAFKGTEVISRTPFETQL